MAMDAGDSGVVMEGGAFDRLVHRLRATARRRTLLAGLAAGLAGSAVIAADSGAKKKKKKTTICRNGQTLSVVKKKQQKHLKPGDTAGACPAAGTTARPGTTVTSTTSGPTCPDLKPGDDLQAAIDAAEPESTLRLCPGTFRITSPLKIENDVILKGAGKAQTILDGEDATRVLEVGLARTVTVQDLTITRGTVQENNSGGGIANSGNLTLRRMAVTFCTASLGGGIANFGDGVLTMGVDSTVDRNTAITGGGGIFNIGRVFMNEGSFVTDNTAANGGGIVQITGDLTLNAGSFVTDNTATTGTGGGIHQAAGTVTLKSDSHVERNEPDNCEPAIDGCG